MNRSYSRKHSEKIVANVPEVSKASLEIMVHSGSSEVGELLLLLLIYEYERMIPKSSVRGVIK